MNLRTLVASSALSAHDATVSIEISYKYQNASVYEAVAAICKKFEKVLHLPCGDHSAGCNLYVTQKVNFPDGFFADLEAKLKKEFGIVNWEAMGYLGQQYRVRMAYSDPTFWNEVL